MRILIIISCAQIRRRSCSKCSFPENLDSEHPRHTTFGYLFDGRIFSWTGQFDPFAVAVRVNFEDDAVTAWVIAPGLCVGEYRTED